MSGDCFKLAMKKKLTEAYLKGVSKIFEYLLSFLGYSRFCSKLDDVTNRFSKKINHKIKKISENIHSYFNILRLLSKHGQVSRTSSLDAQIFPTILGATKIAARAATSYYSLIFSCSK